MEEKYTRKDMFDDLEAYSAAEKKLEESYKKAVGLAHSVYKDKCCEDGTPYIDHIMRVAERVIEHDYEINRHAVISVLKDVMQDGSIPYEQLRSEFDSFIADNVKAMTTDKSIGVFDLKSYLEATANARSYFLPVIKIFERTDNIDILSNCTDKSRLKEYLDETLNIFIPVYKTSGDGREKEKLLEELEKKAKDIKI